MADLIEWNDQRKKVFLDRYAAKDADGNLLEKRPEEMWKRVAEAIGKDDLERKTFFDLLQGFRFLPAGRILLGAGSGQTTTLFNCYVLGIRSDDPKKGNDSRRGIMSTMSDIVEITAKGGGCGLNWAILRPEGSHIHGVNGKSSGVEAWMHAADALANGIRQGGSRSAAMLFMLDDWHPDVFSFVGIKDRFDRANFSVNISDDFMTALKEDSEWQFIFPDTSSAFYDREWDGDIRGWKDKGLPVIVHRVIKARDLWDRMCESAHKTGSPGVAFLDRCNKQSNTWYLDRIACMNPCAEEPLPVNGCCNLGSINLVTMWDETKKDIRWSELDLVTRYAVRFLDKVTDANEDINQKIGDLQRSHRRIGVGTLGLADLLIFKGIKYGSQESLDFIVELYSFIRNSAYLASVHLAREFGTALGFDRDKFMRGYFIQTLPKEIQEEIFKYGIRNLSILTSPPTGTTSVLAGASSGIEPIFSRDYIRKDATGTFRVTHPLFEGECGKHLVTAMDISPKEHIDVQATLQKFVDASISKTINLPSTATVEDISEAYKYAYYSGCKGVSVYVNRADDGVLTPYCDACNA